MATAAAAYGGCSLQLTGCYLGGPQRGLLIFKVLSLNTFKLIKTAQLSKLLFPVISISFKIYSMKILILLIINNFTFLFTAWGAALTAPAIVFLEASLATGKLDVTGVAKGVLKSGYLFSTVATSNNVFSITPIDGTMIKNQAKYRAVDI